MEPLTDARYGDELEIEYEHLGETTCTATGRLVEIDTTSDGELLGFTLVEYDPLGIGDGVHEYIVQANGAVDFNARGTGGEYSEVGRLEDVSVTDEESSDDDLEYGHLEGAIVTEDGDHIGTIEEVYTEGGRERFLSERANSDKAYVGLAEDVLENLGETAGDVSFVLDTAPVEVLALEEVTA
ncbi:hypothetical protein [Natronococcus roseus]|uniref:hypothetical protein n=1 Tax=Natronococcus roseus TaxID=1052014 RepID=UPI00374CB8CC